MVCVCVCVWKLQGGQEDGAEVACWRKTHTHTHTKDGNAGKMNKQSGLAVILGTSMAELVFGVVRFAD